MTKFILGSILELHYERRFMRNTILKAVNLVLNKLGFRVIGSKEMYLPWPTCFSTVDIAVVDLDNDKILLGRKKDRWCIIGGFTDPSSTYDVEDASRELFEETQLITGKMDLSYIGDTKIQDSRYNDTPHGIRTHFYLLLTNSKLVTPKASDDIDEVCWFSLKDRFALLDGHDSFIQPSHRVLLTMLRKHLTERYNYAY